ncbi:MAG: hypothetical protein GF334_02670 [Candidatus Altiarchaeales archaeon]|nr:hypothetical protein [Candidatus Altiarchaeales archaeon]
MLTYAQALALENKVRAEMPYFDGIDFLENDEGNIVVRGVDVDVDVCPMTGLNKCRGVDLNQEGEILKDLYHTDEDEE